ncbi:MAG: hypothetical protein RLZ55_582 [Actinomycetota bacterium]
MQHHEDPGRLPPSAGPRRRACPPQRVRDADHRALVDLRMGTDHRHQSTGRHPVDRNVDDVIGAPKRALSAGEGGDAVEEFGQGVGAHDTGRPAAMGQRSRVVAAASSQKPSESSSLRRSTAWLRCR